MNDPFTNDAAETERARKAQADSLEKLRERASDKPAHLAYIEALMTADRERLWDVPLVRGVSNRIANALETDVSWIRQDPARVSEAFPSAYGLQRLADARAASARRRAREQPQDGLASLLQLDDGTDDE